MAAIISTSGFEMSKVPAPVGLLPAVEGFQQVKSLLLNPNQVMFKWNCPLDIPVAGVYLYRIMRAATAVFQRCRGNRHQQQGRSFVDTNETGAVQTYTYWVIPTNNIKRRGRKQFCYSENSGSVVSMAEL